MLWMLVPGREAVFWVETIPDDSLVRDSAEWMMRSVFAILNGGGDTAVAMCRRSGIESSPKPVRASRPALSPCRSVVGRTRQSRSLAIPNSVAVQVLE